jgi:hypothetical protein
MKNINVFVIILLFSSFVNANDECIPKIQIQEMLTSGAFDSIFKTRVTLEEQLSNLEMINLIRSTLDSNDEGQLSALILIDQKTNKELEQIAFAVTLQENQELFLSKKKRILLVTSAIRGLREDSKSKVVVDETPLNNLESLFGE